MLMLKLSFTFYLTFMLKRVSAFVPSMGTTRASTRSVAPPALNAAPEIFQALESTVQSSDLVLNKVTTEDFGELAKSFFIVLLFGGGLIPAAIAANKSMIGTLSGKRAGGDDDRSKYVMESGASGPELPGQTLMFASEKIPLVDVIAIMGRIQGYQSIADWRNLPSTERSPNVMWLPRDMFKENIRKAKFLGWPVDPVTGQPIGGFELEKAEKGRISKSNPKIGDAALDAVFDTWAWGASIATPDKVETTLALYKNGNSFNIDEFVGAAIRGRAVTGLGALTFIVIQVVAYGTLFIAPFLRVFFDIDIGFGQLGECDGVCKTLF
jgi:hypothetical protein